MGGKSGISRKISFWLSNATADEMERLIKTSPKNPHMSVDLFCKDIVERYVWRHSTRKFKK